MNTNSSIFTSGKVKILLFVFMSEMNKRAKMALNRSPEFKVVTVQIVCVVEIQSESARALTNITSATLAMPNFMHLRQVVLKKIPIFFCVFLCLLTDQSGSP